ncbi:MAG: hypothetical protein ACLFR2_11895 [Candidatus Kapaibacterium sp.]
MLSFNKILALLIAISFIAVSCSDDDNGTGPSNGDNPYDATFSFTAGGNDYNYEFSAGAYDNDSEMTLIVAAKDTSAVTDFNLFSGEAFFLSFSGDGTGTFSISEDNDNEMIFVQSGNYFMASSGSIEITSFQDVNGEISGTFSGTFNNPMTNEDMEITNGTFTVPRFEDGFVEDQDDDNNNNGDGSLEFTIDGDGYSNQEVKPENVNYTNATYGIAQEGHLLVQVEGSTMISGESQDLMFYSLLEINENETGTPDNIYTLYFYLGEDQYMSTSVDVNITEFGNEGEEVSGTFSGEFQNILTQETVDISGGSFTVSR